MRKYILQWLTLIGLTLGAMNFTYADDTKPLSQRPDIQKFINSMVKKYDFNKKQLEQLFNQVKLRPYIVKTIKNPFEKQTWDVYKSHFLTAERIQGGVAFWRAHQKALAKAQAKYKVPAAIIVAILGVETKYGKTQGNHRVIDALSTLAFNYPKRQRFFKKELTQFLLLAKEQHFNLLTIKGSYAGAIGQPQFMPSSYRAYAVDFDNDGTSNLLSNDNDVIGSVANYFHKHGWKQGQAVVVRAKVSGKGYQRLNTHAKKPIYSLNTLKKRGVTPLSKLASPTSKLGLIKLENKSSNEYWIAYNNFYVITRYNTSKLYAMAVYQLSQKIAQQYKDQAKAATKK